MVGREEIEMEVFVPEVNPETYILMLALPPPPSLTLGRVYATKSYCEDTTSLRPNLEEGGNGGRGGRRIRKQKHINKNSYQL